MKYLLTIALGPVQEFIAAARRTADLKAGSQLLVETARKVAAHLEAQGAELIFPANTHIAPLIRSSASSGATPRRWL